MKKLTVNVLFNLGGNMLAQWWWKEVAGGINYFLKQLIAKLV